MPQMFIGSFNLGNLVHVFEADGANCLVAWSAGSLLDACCLFQKKRHAGSFREEGEGSIGLDVDHGGNWDTRGNMGCTSVELFAEVHRPHAAGAESGTNRGRWSGLACCDEETLFTGVGVSMKWYRRKRDARQSVALLRLPLTWLEERWLTCTCERAAECLDLTFSFF